MKSPLLGKFIYLHVYAHFINNYWESKLYSLMRTLLICFLADWHCPCNQFLFQISTLTNLLFYLLHHFLPYPWDTHVGCWASLPKCSYQASLQSKCAKCEKEWTGGEHHCRCGNSVCTILHFYNILFKWLPPQLLKCLFLSEPWKCTYFHVKHLVVLNAVEMHILVAHVRITWSNIFNYLPLRHLAVQSIPAHPSGCLSRDHRSEQQCGWEAGNSLVTPVSCRLAAFLQPCWHEWPSMWSVNSFSAENCLFYLKQQHISEVFLRFCIWSSSLSSSLS